VIGRNRPGHAQWAKIAHSDADARSRRDPVNCGLPGYAIPQVIVIKTFSGGALPDLS
jgi:hypothetical protein